MLKHFEETWNYFLDKLAVSSLYHAPSLKTAPKPRINNPFTTSNDQEYLLFTSQPSSQTDLLCFFSILYVCMLLKKITYLLVYMHHAPMLKEDVL